jgi:hypothetical protein
MADHRTPPRHRQRLVARSAATIEWGTDTFPVTARELFGAERDEVYAEQARRCSGFAVYENQTQGIRVIPVVELTRTSQARTGTTDRTRRPHRPGPSREGSAIDEHHQHPQRHPPRSRPGRIRLLSALIALVAWWQTAPQLAEFITGTGLDDRYERARRRYFVVEAARHLAASPPDVSPCQPGTA